MFKKIRESVVPLGTKVPNFIKIIYVFYHQIEQKSTANLPGEDWRPRGDFQIFGGYCTLISLTLLYAYIMNYCPWCINNCFN